MRNIWRFLHPTWYKLIFLAEWLIYGVIAVFQNQYVIKPIALNFLWPLAFFYLVGCALVAASRRQTGLWRDRRLLGTAGLLVAIDHVIKFAVATRMPLGKTWAIIPGRLDLAHVENATGSWVAASLGSEPVVRQVLVFSLIFMAVAPLVYRYYAFEQRRSFWLGTGYVFVMAGVVSADLDLGLRGVVVDYISLPGHFVADLKDIYLIIGVAAIVIELVDNPRISLQWKGWRGEFRETWEVSRGLVRFAIKDLYGLRRRS